MGDTGSNLLGYLLGVVAVQGALKTNAVIALFLPLIILTCRSSTPASSSPSGSSTAARSTRPTAGTSTTGWPTSASPSVAPSLYLYGWTLLMAALALALRFVPYSDDRGNFDPAWAALMLVFACLRSRPASRYLRPGDPRPCAVRFRPPGRRRQPGRATPAAEDSTARRRELETGQLPGPSIPRPGSSRRSTDTAPDGSVNPHEVA